MHEFYELKEMLMDEVKELTKKGELTAGSLDTVDKLLNSIKNACKIIMYDEYDSEGQYSRQSMQGAGIIRWRAQRQQRQILTHRRYVLWSRRQVFPREFLRRR